LSLNISGVLKGTPENDDVGTYWIEITATDALFAKTVRNFTLTVSNVNDAPEINFAPLTTATEDTQYQLSLTATDIDPTGDVLTWHLISNATWLKLNTTTNKIEGTPLNADVGTCWANVSVDDGNGGCDWSNFTLTVVDANDAPAISGNNILDAYEDSVYFSQYTVTDIDTDDTIFTWTLNTNATWLSLSSIGNLSGIPDNEDVGMFWVNVTVSDPHSAFDFLTFDLTVHNTNDIPIWTEVPDDATITIGDSFNFDVNATDADLGDTLTFGIDSLPESLISIDPMNGTVFWTPINVGNYSLTINATDSHVSIYYSFWINVTEPALPNIIPIVKLSTPTNNSHIVIRNPILAWAVFDVDGDEVTCDLYFSKDRVDVQALTAGSKVGSDLNGTTFTPATLLDKGATYYWTMIPYDGKDDGICSSGIWSFTVDENATINHLPLFLSQPGLEGVVGTEWRYKPLTNDEDNDTVIVSLDMCPFNMAIVFGFVTWTPMESQIGNNTVKLKASDGKGFQIQEFVVIVSKDRKINHPPQVEAIFNMSIWEGDNFTVQVLATDSDTDTLTYGFITAPSGATISNSSGLITWQTKIGDAGNHPFLIRVSDNQAYTDITFNVTVNGQDVTGDDDTGNSFWMVFIAGIVVFILLLVILFVVLLLVQRRKRLKQQEEEDDGPETLLAEEDSDSVFVEKRYRDLKKPAVKASDVKIAKPMEAPEEPSEEIPLLPPASIVTDMPPPPFTDQHMDVQSPPAVEEMLERGLPAPSPDFTKPTEDPTPDASMDKLQASPSGQQAEKAPSKSKKALNPEPRTATKAKSTKKMLKQLNELRTAGTITEEEYEVLKKRPSRRNTS